MRGASSAERSLEAEWLPALSARSVYRPGADRDGGEVAGGLAHQNVGDTSFGSLEVRPGIVD